MKLFHSANSPFVRQCLVAAHELGLAERIELVPAAAHPINRDRAVVEKNPLGKIPALITDDGSVLHDSRVIVDFLNDLGGGDLVPVGDARWSVLTGQSLADGMLDAAVLARYETALRPEALRSHVGDLGRQVAAHGPGALLAVAGRKLEMNGRILLNPWFVLSLAAVAFACLLCYHGFGAWFTWFGGRDSMVATKAPSA